MKVKINNVELKLIVGDITDLSVDAIVNAANTHLQLGGGVAGAIRRKGGPEIQEECNKIGKINVGEAVITTAGKLKAKKVIHAVGPIYGEGDEDEKLKSATLNSLKLAEKHDLKTIAFPAISTGIYRFPKQRCAEIMLQTVIDYAKSGTNLRQIIFCLYTPETYNIFCEKLKETPFFDIRLSLKSFSQQSRLKFLSFLVKIAFSFSQRVPHSLVRSGYKLFDSQ